MPLLDENGHEILDNTRPAIPLRFSRMPSALDNARRLVNQAIAEASSLAQEYDFETFEESNDFDVGDDYDPTDQSIYEYTPEQERGFIAAIEDVRNPVVADSEPLASPPRPERGEESPKPDSGAGPGASPEAKP